MSDVDKGAAGGGERPSPAELEALDAALDAIVDAMARDLARKDHKREMDKKGPPTAAVDGIHPATQASPQQTRVRAEQPDIPPFLKRAPPTEGS